MKLAFGLKSLFIKAELSQTRMIASVGWVLFADSSQFLEIILSLPMQNLQEIVSSKKED